MIGITGVKIEEGTPISTADDLTPRIELSTHIKCTARIAHRSDVLFEVLNFPADLSQRTKSELHGPRSPSGTPYNTFPATYRTVWTGFETSDRMS